MCSESPGNLVSSTTNAVTMPPKITPICHFWVRFTAALPPHEPTAPKGLLPHASPTIRKLARELGVPLEEVKGTGPKGRITHDDVHGFVKAVMAAAGEEPAWAHQA